MYDYPAYLKRFLKIYPLLAGIITVAAGATAVAGWLMNSDDLMRLGIGEHLIQVNLAFCLILIGLASTLLNTRNRIAASLVALFSFTVILIGIAGLFEYYSTPWMLTDRVLYLFLLKTDLLKPSPVGNIGMILLGLLFLFQSSKLLYNFYSVNFVAVLVFSLGFIGYLASVLNLIEIIESKAFVNVADVVWLTFIFLPLSVLLYNLVERDFKVSVEQKLLAGLTFITVIILFTATNSGARIRDIQRINSMIKSTIQIKESLRIVQGYVLDIQSGVRGFIISNDTRFLDNSDKATNDLPGAINHLDSLLTDTPEQQESLQVLDRLVSERIQQAQQSIKLRLSSGKYKSDSNFEIMTGKLITDSIRKVVRQMIDKENKLLDIQNDIEVERAKKIRSIIYANLVLQIILILLIFRAVVSSLRERRKSMEEIRQVNESLEIRIKDRTGLLEASETKYKFLFENNPLPMLIFDVRTLSIFEVNDAAINLYGYTEEEFLSMIITDLRLAEDADDLIRHLETNAGIYSEFKNLKHRKKNGEIIYVEIYDHPLTIKGRKAIFILINDITIKITADEEIRKMNEMLEQKVSERTSQLETANRAKSDFLANMSHEIRTPMNAILGYSELLGSILSDQNQKNYLSSIKSSGRMLLTLINDILDISKIEAGKLELEYEYVDTHFFFSEFEKIFSFKVNEKGLRFITEISPELPQYLCIDGPRVRQIILNLAGNAVKFTDRGSIILRFYPAENRYAAETNLSEEKRIDLIAEIEDTGVGIPDELHNTVFESFMQVKSKTSQSGTGLGLAISKKLVELMNGTITIRSEPGKGSTFTVRIPDLVSRRSYDHNDDAGFIDPSEIIFERATVIVADDVEQNRKLIRDILCDTPLAIVEADNGLDALKLIKDLNPDLVIADIRMPGLDGFELLNAIKSDDNLKQIHVVAYSASVMKEQKEKILKSEFAGLLIKPVQIAELYEILMRFLPYKSKSINVLQNTSGALTDEKILDLPALCNALNGTYAEKWHAFQVRQPLGEVKDFGRSLIELGTKHNSLIIKNYGEELAEAALNFNVEKMLILLGKYREKILSVQENI